MGWRQQCRGRPRHGLWYWRSLRRRPNTANEHRRAVAGAKAGGVLEPRRTRHRARRRRTTAGVRSSAVETARSDAAVVDVAEDTANGALEDEATNASRVAVATGDGGFDGVGDRVDHGVHGGSRCRSRHLLPVVVACSNSDEVPVKNSDSTKPSGDKQGIANGAGISSCSHQLIPSVPSLPDSVRASTEFQLEPGALRHCDERMAPAQDPFYIVKDEIQDSIDKVQDTFHQWKQTPENTGEYVHLTKELLTSCESIHWQVDELEKAISVAERDPAYYGLNEAEIGRRRSWTSTARNQVLGLKRNVEGGRQKSVFGRSTIPSESIRSKKNIVQDNDEFISSESDQQMLLIKRQDEELDALSASVQRIGGVGLTIHDELVGQEKLLGELSLDMETTTNRLDFVQKRVAMVMKKASWKGQIMMIAFLVILFIILFVLVFLT